MSDSKILIWESYSLYVATGEEQREYIGSIIRGTFRDDWACYVRGKWVRTLNSESAARKHLEAHA